MKKLVMTITLAVPALFVGTIVGQQNQANRLKTADNTFVTKAAQGGMAEVELGRLATERAANAKVKQFGQQMVDDHTKANDELKSIASGKGVTLPSMLDSKDQATKNKLSSLQGAAFDRAYMEDMVSDHEKDIAEFQREADHGTDADMKAFASKTLPTLQHHLQMAKDALADVKSSGK
jgi:putative membrane protein